jgi:serine O-acetyltransferase
VTVVLQRITEDIRTAIAEDPAAKSYIEVALCYPGLHALWFHRAAHWFYLRRMYTVARIISHVSRGLTGIEIHPGAEIGRRVFIDHGMGIVIGETSVVGDGCLLYKGIVLGGTTLEKKKRHPTLGRNVVVGTNSCLLGAINVGDGARIGANSVVVKDVPAGATAVGVPARVVEEKKKADLEPDFEHGRLPDPIQEVVKTMLGIQQELESRIKKLEKEHGIKSPPLVRDHPGKAEKEK